MNERIENTPALCRHQKWGRCTNHFWKIMKKSGKSGLADYTCLLWAAKLEKIDRYSEAAWRAECFGLAGPEREKILARQLARKPVPEPTCPDFRPDPISNSPRCRYFYLGVCLLRFPFCPGRCEDFLPPGDQHS